MRFQGIASLALLVLLAVVRPVVGADHRKNAFIPLEEKIRKEQEHAKIDKANRDREKKRASKMKFVKKVMKEDKELGQHFKKKMKIKEDRHAEVKQVLKDKDKERARKQKHMAHDKKIFEKKMKKKRNMNAGRREL